MTKKRRKSPVGSSPVPAGKRSTPSVELFIYLLLLFVTAIACDGLLSHEGLPRGDDFTAATMWGASFVESLKDGVFYPRWVNGLSRGLGAPIFILYSRFAYDILAFCSLFAENIIESLQYAMFLATFLSGVSFYLSAKTITSRWAAATGAGVYILMPYRAIDIYQRLAFAESVSFIWLPPIIVSTILIFRPDSRKAWFVFVISYAGLIMTHIASAFTALLIVGPICLILAIITRRLVPIARIGAAGLLAAVITSAYLLPAVLERKHVHLEWSLSQEVLQWKNQFLYEYQPVDRGTVPLIKAPISKTGTLIVIAGLVAGSFLLIRLLGGARLSPDRRLPRNLVALLVIALWCYFLQVRPSAFIWEHLPMLESVQFPWRFASWHAASTCLILAVVIGVSHPASGETIHSRSSTLDRIANPIVRSVVVLLAFVPPSLFALQLQKARPYVGTMDRYEMITNRGPVIKEYVPTTIASWEILTPDLNATARVQASTPQATTNVLSWSTHERRIVVDSPVETDLLLKTLFFPGWTARSNNEVLPTRTEPRIGRMIVTVPAGRHDIAIRFEQTGPRKAGVGLTILGLVCFGVLVSRQWRRGPAGAM